MTSGTSLALGQARRCLRSSSNGRERCASPTCSPNLFPRYSIYPGMKIQPLVRFATLLHKRVVPDVLAGLSGSQLGSEALTAALDALPSRSHAVVLALEELIAALYAPQQPAALSSAVSAFSDAVRHLHTSVVTDVFLPPETDLANAMGALSVGEVKSGNGAKAKKDPRKWFDACLGQIDKSAKAVEDMLSPDPHNAT